MFPIPFIAGPTNDGASTDRVFGAGSEIIVISFCGHIRLPRECGFTRFLIHQPFAASTNDRFCCAFGIPDAKARAIVVAKIELGKIAMQMLLANMMESSDDAALENGKIVFSGVDVNETAEAHIFIGSVVHGSVVGELLADFRVSGVFVSHQM